MSNLDPIIPEPMWERPSPNIPDDEVYEDDDEDLGWEDDQCIECGEIGEDCVCEQKKRV